MPPIFGLALAGAAVKALIGAPLAARPDARMQISVEQGQLMDWLVRTLDVRRAIEIGTFTGYSALRVGLALPADGRLLCCDVNPETGAVAQAYWEQAGIASKVSLRLGPAVDTLDALIGLGMTQQRAGKYAESEAALQKAFAYDADNANASYAMAVTYFKQERWKDSMTFFEKSLDKSPQNASARHYLGIIATKLSLMERAEREFKTALAIDPNHGEAHFNLAVLYATWDPPQWDKARESYAAALKKGVKPDQSLERLLEGGKKVSQN
jgi:tetratricopeptide (TPR) repeat protein